MSFKRIVNAPGADILRMHKRIMALGLANFIGVRNNEGEEEEDFEILFSEEPDQSTQDSVDAEIASALANGDLEPDFGRHTLIQENISSGNSNWRYAMGPEFKVKAMCQITEISIYLGSNVVGQDHTWEIVKNSQASNTAPLLSDYDDILATGVINYSDANQWATLKFDTPIVLEEGEWVHARVNTGGAGQSFDIPTARSRMEIDESFLYLHAGLFRYTNSDSDAPSPLPVPSSRRTTRLYGIVSLKVEGL